METKPDGAPQIVINGEHFLQTDAVIHVLAADMIRDIGEREDIDLETMHDNRKDSDPSLLDRQLRFGPIKAIMEALSEKTDYESAISWLVTPIDGIRPLDTVSTDEWQKLLVYIKSDAFTIFS